MKLAQINVTNHYREPIIIVGHSLKAIKLTAMFAALVHQIENTSPYEKLIIKTYRTSACSEMKFSVCLEIKKLIKAV